ncbi:MAG: hypothetical protein L0Y56_22785, partial [Nitrospira sp.]|nr:hypothetical protein [Nitrospira sp.]
GQAAPQAIPQEERARSSWYYSRVWSQGIMTWHMSTVSSLPPSWGCKHCALGRKQGTVEDVLSHLMSSEHVVNITLMKLSGEKIYTGLRS